MFRLAKRNPRSGPAGRSRRRLGKVKVLGRDSRMVILGPVDGFDDPIESTFLSELVEINCTPMGVEMERVPMGAVGLMEDWHRVGGYLRRAMDNVATEEG